MQPDNNFTLTGRPNVIHFPFSTFANFERLFAGHFRTNSQPFSGTVAAPQNAWQPVHDSLTQCGKMRTWISIGALI